ncbi:unnamed protein product, partial [Ectocarpus sp. 4 AP-2014]
VAVAAARGGQPGFANSRPHSHSSHSARRVCSEMQGKITRTAITTEQLPNTPAFFLVRSSSYQRACIMDARCFVRNTGGSFASCAGGLTPKSQKRGRLHTCKIYSIHPGYPNQ